MKTVMILSEDRVNKHVGETYDEVIEVVREPTTDNLEFYIRRIESVVRSLWDEDVASVPKTEQPRVVAFLDAASPFAAILIDLSVILKEQNGIVVELPWYEPDDISGLDQESRELLENLERK